MKHALYVLMLLLPLTVQAQAASCSVTPALPAANYPGAANIVPSNDLTRAAGKATAVTDGQTLVLSGRVLDKHCMPVPNLIVELWQTNPYGAWRLATQADRVSTTPTFNGAGRARTDVNGQFQFITLFPGPVKGQGPRLNIRTYPKGAPFSTVLFFADDGRNEKDPLYRRLKPQAQAQLTLAMQLEGDGFVAQTTLVLPVKASYLTY